MMPCGGRSPTQPATLHRGLGFRPSTPTHFAHDADHPLPVDLALVDEASMVDLALMSKLVAAVPAEARLVLLGDKNQLASVEAGAILGDVCRTDARPATPPSFAASSSSWPAPRRCPTIRAPPALRGSAIASSSWCTAIASRPRGASGAGPRDQPGGWSGHRAGPGRPVEPSRIPSADVPVALVPLSEEDELATVLAPIVMEGFAALMSTREPPARLRALSRFRLLSPHRHGRYGVLALNRLVEQRLSEEGLINPRETWYDGRPVIVTENDHQLELYNGDVGLVHRDEGRPPRGWCSAPPGAGCAGWPPPGSPPHETVFAMTVHKSQGSEFDRVALTLPAAVSPVLTRELVYTAITRARQQIVVYGVPSVLEKAVGRRIDRASGLREALWEA